MHWHRIPSFAGRVMLGVVIALVAASAVVGLALRSAGRRDVVGHLRRAPEMRVVDVTPIRGSASRLRQLELVDSVGRVRATIRDPPAAAGRVPAVIILGGARTGQRAVELVDTDLPLTVAALEHAWTDAASARGLGAVARVATLPRDLLRTAVALRDLTRILKRDPRVDGGRVYLVGASLGSPIASAVAATERPAGLVLLYGFADHGALLDHRLRRDVPWTIVRRPLGAAGAALTANFDAVRTLPQACGTPVLVVASPDDRDLPRQSQEALWNATCAPRWRVEMRGGHLQSGRDPVLLRRATRVVVEWLAERERAAGGQSLAPLSGGRASGNSGDWP